MTERNTARDFSNLPAIFHITHWKAGSQWVYQVLQGVAPERTVTPQIENAHLLENTVRPGMIYPTVYMTLEQFERVVVPGNRVIFVVIRDLRDTLISYYFSLKVSHAIIDERISRDRRVLSELSLEEGLRYAMRLLKVHSFERIQTSWLNSNALILRYEDLLADEYGQFEKLMRHCQIDVGNERLREVVARNSFETRAGRRRGEEDVSSHYRKGIAGDWRNYFSDTVKAAFKEHFGDVLIATGYEEDHNW